MKILILFLSLFSYQTFANDTIVVKVKGMVCAFCTNGIEKKFKSQNEVKDIKVNLDDKMVTIFFNKGKVLSNKKITELVTGSGFNVASISKGTKK